MCTPVFVQGNIRELFSSDESVSTTAEKVPEVVETAKKEEEEAMEVSDKSIEQMLAQVEDESDVKAASRAKQEQVAELAEFDESFLETAGPLDKVRCYLLGCVSVCVCVVQPSAQSVLPVSFLYETCQDPEESKVAMELAALEEQVRGVVGAATHSACKLTSCVLPLPL